MNCTRIEKLLPLAAGDDLAPREMTQVRAHLAQCAACRAEAAALAESRARWQQPLSDGLFDETFFAALRAATHAELMAEQMKAAAREATEKRFALGWFWRPLPLAACAALLLTAGIWLSHLIQMKGTPPPDIVITPPAPVQPLLPKLFSVAPPKPLLAQAVKRAKPVTRAKSLLPLSLELPSSQLVLAEARSEPSAPEMLRMEIQTADPNIRIIWLTPKDQLPEPSKLVTGAK